MDNDVETRFRGRAHGYVTISDKSTNLVTQGDSEEHARSMFEEMVELSNGNGQHILDRDLSHYGLDSNSLDIKSLPKDFEEFPFVDSLLDSSTMATVLMQHGFRPISKTENHLKFIDIRDNIEYPIIIPMHGEVLDPFVSGFIAGHLGQDAEPNAILGWFEQTS